MARTVELIVAAAAAAVLSVVYVILAGRTLGPSAYADFAAALSIIHFFAVMMSPLAPALARVAARMTADGLTSRAWTLRSAVMKRLVLLSSIAFALLMVLSFPASRWLHFRSPSPVIVASAAAVLFALVSAERGILQGLFLFRSYNINIFLEALVRTAGAFVLLHLFPADATVALLSYVAALIAAGTLMAIFAGRPDRTEGEKTVDWTELRTLTVPIFLLMVAAAGFQNFDMLAVKRWMPAADAGVYGAAVALARSFAVLFVPLYVLSGPLLSRAHQQRQPIVGPALRLTAIYVFCSLPPLFVLMLWPERISRALFGSEFAGLSGMILPLSAVIILLHASLLLTQVLITAGDFRFLWSYGVALIFFLAGLTLFHQSIGQVLLVSCTTQLLLLVAVSAHALRVRS